MGSEMCIRDRLVGVQAQLQLLQSFTLHIAVFWLIARGFVNQITHIRNEALEERRSLSPSEIRRRIERFVAGGSDQDYG